MRALELVVAAVGLLAAARLVATRAADKGMLAGGFVALGVGGAALVASIVPFMLAAGDCISFVGSKPAAARPARSLAV